MSVVSALSLSGRFSTTFATAPSIVNSTDILPPRSCFELMALILIDRSLALGRLGRSQPARADLWRGGSWRLDLGQPAGADFGFDSREQGRGIGPLTGSTALLEPFRISPQIGQRVVRHLRQLGDQIHFSFPASGSRAFEIDTRRRQFIRGRCGRGRPKRITPANPRWPSAII